MASLNITQVRTADVAGTYTITMTVTAATGMPAEVFSWAAASDKYDHVATVSDMLVFPTTLSQSMAYYRKNTATLTCATLSDAKAALGVFSTRLQDLVTNYGLQVTAFVGTEQLTFTA